MKKTFNMTLLMITLVSILNILFSYQIKYVIDALVIQDLSKFYASIIQMMVVLLAMLIAEFIRQVLNERYLNNIGYQLNKTVIGNLFSKSTVTVETLSEISNDIEMVKSDYYNTLFSLYQGVISFLLSVIALFLLDTTTASWILIVSVFPMLIPYLYKTRRTMIQEAISKYKKEYTIFLKDIILGITVIKNSLKERMFYDKANSKYHKINQLSNQKAVIIALINVLVGLFFYLTILIILFVGGLQILEGKNTVGTLTAIYSVSTELVFPITLISESISRIGAVKGILKKLKENVYIPTQPKVSMVNFQNGSIKPFDYVMGDKRKIHIPELNLQANKNYLIVGRSGIGKSTLAYLLTKNYDTIGTVFLNGKDLDEYNYQEVQQLISFVPQEPYLFQASIWHNLTLFGEVDKKELFDLIEHFGLKERFPTEESLVNEIYLEDSNLSGGQKQRIGLIRALLQHRPILLLDEGLSALDKATYDQIEQYLLTKAVTLIHISHRQTTGIYDEIINMEHYTDK